MPLLAVLLVEDNSVRRQEKVRCHQHLNILTRWTSFLASPSRTIQNVCGYYAPTKPPLFNTHLILLFYPGACTNKHLTMTHRSLSLLHYHCYRLNTQLSKALVRLLLAAEIAIACHFLDASGEKRAWGVGTLAESPFCLCMACAGLLQRHSCLAVPCLR